MAASQFREIRKITVSRVCMGRLVAAGFFVVASTTIMTGSREANAAAGSTVPLDAASTKMAASRSAAATGEEIATTPTPTVSLTANPMAIGSGTTTTLVWSSTNATACAASGGWSGAKPTSGRTSTRALAVTTSFSLQCSGAGGGGSATIAVTVSKSNPVTVQPQLAPLTRSQPQQFTATVTGGGAVTWSVAGVAGGNAAFGTISANGLYQPGSAVGSHTVAATSVANASQSGTALVAVTNLDGVYTYHNDSARTGQNLQEYALTPATVASAKFGRIWTCAVDGDIYAQPLYVAHLEIAGAVHNVVFVATEHDSVYAFDADAPSCVTYWHRSFVNGTTITPVPASVAYKSSQLENWDILNEIGITGTPVISAATRTLYVVAKTQETNADNDVSYHDRLHALALGTGHEQTNSPVAISATAATKSGTLTFRSIIQNQRPALLLADYTNGAAVYIAWSSYGDLGAYHGWVMAYDAETLAQVGVWNDTPNGTKGGIWMSGDGLAADSSGALYLSTGNGTFDDSADIVPPLAPNNDFGESFVKLDPSSLTVTDYYTPSQNSEWTEKDEDLASSGVAVLPDGIGPTGHPNLFVASDKEGHLWLIDRDLMSRFSPTSDNTVQFLTLPGIAACSLNCTFSTPAFYNGTVYIGEVVNPVMAFTLADGLFSESGGIASASSVSSELYGFPGATPAISASPAGDAIVWVLDTNANGTYTQSPFAPLGPAVLRAYNASNLAQTLYSSSKLASDAAGNAVKFATPVIANGHVYVAGSHQLTVYGLTQ